jgi:hypothetical protein
LDKPTYVRCNIIMQIVSWGSENIFFIDKYILFSNSYVMRVSALHIVCGTPIVKNDVNSVCFFVIHRKLIRQKKNLIHELRSKDK